MDRRKSRREFSLTHTRRRYPRLHLDVDWFVESSALAGRGCSTLGRGLEISPRGALLPVTCIGQFSSDVTLHVALPSRPRMFKAHGVAIARRARGWAIEFRDVSPEDLQLLAMTLIEEHGVAAVPSLERKYARFLGFEARYLRDSPSNASVR
jgi:hypothetical protein